MFTLEDFKRGNGRLFVFDAESIGLHGEVFAVGYSVYVKDGPVAERLIACDPDMAKGSYEDRAWVMQNVPKMHYGYANPKEVRDEFWKAMREEIDYGAVLCADVNWPVESNFLSACIADDWQNRRWLGPYPLMEISSFLWAAGINPLATAEREPGELPAHQPLNDARQSGRLLLQALGITLPKQRVSDFSSESSDEGC